MSEPSGEAIGETKLSDPGDKLILIIDDDESILDLMEHIVKKEGFKVARSEEGREALRKAVALRPDLIVLDFMLPGLTGIEVIRELQSQGTADIPVLVITGRRIDRQKIEIIRQE